MCLFFPPVHLSCVNFIISPAIRTQEGLGWAGEGFLPPLQYLYVGCLFLFYWSTVDLQRCVNFCYIAKGFSYTSVQSSSVAQSCPTLCDPMDRSTPGLLVQLPELTQTHVHWVGDAIQPSHPLSSASPPTLNRSQHQGVFQWVSSLHQVAKLLDFQLQHQSFQWTPRTDFL